MRVQFNLLGPFATEAGTTRLPELERPPPEHFVAMLETLNRVEVEVRCSYRRGGGWFQRREKTVVATATVSARDFRAAAASYWSRGARDDLAERLTPES